MDVLDGVGHNQGQGFGLVLAPLGGGVFPLGPEVGFVGEEVVESGEG